MKTAKELFEELGFYLKYKTEHRLAYMNERKTEEYSFIDIYKKVHVYDEFDLNYLSPKMVQAIYKQCEELGWLDDEEC